MIPKHEGERAEGGRVSKRRRSFCDSGQLFGERDSEQGSVMAPLLLFVMRNNAEEGDAKSSLL